GQIGGAHGDHDDDDSSRGKRGGPKFGDIRSWKVVSSRLNRLRRLGVFDKQGSALRYDQMLQPGRVNIIDLSDLENLDVRNLAIAEILRGVLVFQQQAYERAIAEERRPIPTNIIIEEAHEFLSAKRITKMPTLRDQLVKIAKRGRKRH